MERPRGAKEFQRLIQRHAAEIGQSPQRVMHLIRVGVVCAFLDGVRHADGAHVFVVKGGTAMQLRLGIRARATTDLDVMFRGRVEDWLARFDEATVDQSWEGFTVTRKGPPVQIAVEGVGYKPWRVPLQVRFDGREFGSISLEVAIDNDNNAAVDLVRADGIELASFGIDAPQMIPCLDVAAQIAQKLHACTELVAGGNLRVRDVIDIWLLEALLEPDGLASLREEAVSVFRRRRKHDWPPLVLQAHFPAGDYELLAVPYPDAPATTDDAIGYLCELIAVIDAAKRR